MTVGKTHSEITTHPTKMGVTTATERGTQQYVCECRFSGLAADLVSLADTTLSESSSCTVSFRLSVTVECRITIRYVADRLNVSTVC